VTDKQMLLLKDPLTRFVVDYNSVHQHAEGLQQIHNESNQWSLSIRIALCLAVLRYRALNE